MEEFYKLVWKAIFRQMRVQRRLERACQTFTLQIDERRR